jgi:aspartate/methionine/tyrosine aminotransferase
MSEVTIGPGAYFVISDLLMTFVKPNQQEEVVVFEPSYPCYYDHIQYAGGVVKGAALELKDGEWKFNADNFRRALTPKTKVLIFNNAQNPTGKIFSTEEMAQIAEILKEHPQIIVMSDEVYDFLTFDGKKFTPFASIGDNYNRTVTVWSGGKLFNATGWKCGWGVGPAPLIKQAGLHTYATIYCANTPVQVAMAKSLDKTLTPGYKDGLSYEEATCKEFQEVRDMFTEGLKKFDLPIKLLPC